MADEPLHPAPLIGGRHAPNAEGLLARFAELEPVGPVIEIPNGIREDLGLRQETGRHIWSLDLGKLIGRLLVDAPIDQKTSLMRGLGRALRSTCPEAADYLEAFGS